MLSRHGWTRRSPVHPFAGGGTRGAGRSREVCENAQAPSSSALPGSTSAASPLRRIVGSAGCRRRQVLVWRPHRRRAGHARTSLSLPSMSGRRGSTSAVWIIAARKGWTPRRSSLRLRSLDGSLGSAPWSRNWSGASGRSPFAGQRRSPVVRHRVEEGPRYTPAGGVRALLGDGQAEPGHRSLDDPLASSRLKAGSAYGSGTGGAAPWPSTGASRALEHPRREWRRTTP